MWQPPFRVSIALIARTYFGYPAILLASGRLRCCSNVVPGDDIVAKVKN